MTMMKLSDLGANDYGDPLEEARQCRQDSALFDFSFMSRGRLSGPAALGYLQEIQTRDLSTMRPGDIRYCLNAAADGAVSSDLTVWQLSESAYDVYSGQHADIDRIGKGLPAHCDFLDLSDSTSVLSVQGPDSLDVLSRFGDRRVLESLSYFQHAPVRLDGIACRIGRLGYTGEKGFEVVLEEDTGRERAWHLLRGAARPAGVAAIDILRIEAGFILFLNECRLGCNAAELGLGGFASRMDAARRYTLVCFRATDQSVAMPWSPLPDLAKPDDGEIAVTSAARSVLCEGILGLGLVRHPVLPGKTYRDSADRFHGIEIVNRPFYDPRKSIPRSDW